MRILARLFSLTLALFYAFNPYVPPSDATPITASLDSRLRFIAWADPQISNYMPKRDPFFVAACEDVKNADVRFDAMVIAGDIAENGLACEYDHVSEYLYAENVRNYLIAVGNHDVRLRNYAQTIKRFTAFTNGLNQRSGSNMALNSLHYRLDIKGYTFLILGTDRTEFEESYLSDAQLQWLDASLKDAASNGKPVFVVCHQSFKLSHGLPDTWNSPFDFAGSIGDQSDALKTILSSYPNVIFISGHLHTGFGAFTYENIGGIHSVNLPSLTINNKDGNRNDNGLGCFVEVFADEVVFHARNFAKGENIPEEDIHIALV